MLKEKQDCFNIATVFTHPWVSREYEWLTSPTKEALKADERKN